QRVPAVAERLSVQGAAATAGEVGVVEEDAGTVGAGGRAPGRRLAVDGVHLGVVLEAAPVVLPRLRGQPLRRGAHPLLVVGVGEERAVRAAAIAGPVLDDAVAAA